MGSAFDKERVVECLQILSDLHVGRFVDHEELIDQGCSDCLVPVASLLSGLGAVEMKEGTIKLRSQTASLFMKSLAEYIANDIDLIAGWSEEKGKPAEITDKNALLAESLLYLMEKRRIGMLGGSAKVLRENNVVRVVFKAMINGRDCYLMQYDSTAKQYQLVGGYVDGSDRDAYAAAVREIGEELPQAGLEVGDDYHLKEIYRTERPEKALSSTYGVYSSYDLTVFFAHDVEDGVLSKIDTRVNSWITYDEILRGRAHDGRRIFRISTEMLDAMRKLGRSFGSSKILVSQVFNDRRIQIAGLLITAVSLVFTILAFFQK